MNSIFKSLNIGLRWREYIFSILLTILYFDIINSFFIVNFIYIKKWYVFCFLIPFILGVKISAKEKNLIILYLLSIVAFALSKYQSYELILQIKIFLLYFCPIGASLIIYLLPRSYAKTSFIFLIVCSIIYLVFDIYYICTDPPVININGIRTVVDNSTTWRNPVNEKVLIRYTFPGMEQGMFAARLYPLFFTIFYFFITQNYIFIIFLYTVYISLLITASRSSLLGLYLGSSFGLLLNKKIEKKITITLFISIISAILIFPDYHFRNIGFLYGFESIKEIIDNLFGFDISHVFPSMNDVKNDYHLKYNTTKFLDSTLHAKDIGVITIAEYNKEQFERPLSLCLIIIRDLGLASALFIGSYFIYLLFSVFKVIYNKENNLYKFLFITIIPALLIKVVLNQGENEYYVWITLGLFSNLAVKHDK